MNNKTTSLLMVCFLLTGAVYASGSSSDSIYFKNTVPIKNVVVTGTRNKTDERHLPMTVSVINRQQISNRYTPSLLTVLSEQVPGYFNTERSIMGYGVSTGSAGSMSIRGIGGSPTTGLLVLIDGHPQYMGLMGHPLSDAYQSMIAEKVEVVRGPASVLYGSNAMGGVVNIVTRKMAQDGVRTDIRAGYGSYNTLMTEGVNRTHFGKFSSVASLSYNRTDGQRSNMSFEQMSGYAKVGYQLSNLWNAYADLDVIHFNTSNPGSVSSPLIDNDSHITRGGTSVVVENDYGITSGAIKLFYNWGNHKINDGYNVGANPKEYLFRSKDYMSGFNIYQSVSLFKGNRTTLGFDYTHIEGNAWNAYAAKNVTLTDTTLNEVAGYVDFRQMIGDVVTFDAGARVDHHSQTGTEFIPQLGLSLHLPKTMELKFLVSKGFRNPTIKELFMFRSKNPNLSPEKIMNYEVSFSQHLLDNALYYGLNLFYIDGDNLIQTVNYQNVNTGKVRNYGIEFTASYQISDNLDVTANYSFLHTKYDIVAAPRHKLYAGVNYSVGKIALSTGVQWINGLCTQVTPKKEESYVLWNVRGTYSLCKAVNLFVKGENLLAQRYEINAGYPMPKATVMGGFDLNF